MNDVKIIGSVLLGLVGLRLLWLLYLAFVQSRKAYRRLYVFQFDWMATSKFLNDNGYEFHFKPDIKEKDCTLQGIVIWVYCTRDEYQQIKARINKE